MNEGNETKRLVVQGRRSLEASFGKSTESGEDGSFSLSLDLIDNNENEYYENNIDDIKISCENSSITVRIPIHQNLGGHSFELL